MFLTDAHTHRIPPEENTLALIDLDPGEMPEKTAENMLFSCGIHPKEQGRFTLSGLRESLRENRCSAVGECGLDASLPLPADVQEKLFRDQIAISEELKLPLIVHCVRRYYDLIRLRKGSNAAMPWIVHGFRANEQIGEALIRSGMKLSLSPVWLLHLTLFPDWLDDRAFLLETDECAIPLQDIYAHAAKLRGETVKELARLVRSNFTDAFGPGQVRK